MSSSSGIDINKNYVGKIVRTSYVQSGQEHSSVGIVYQQEKVGAHLRFTLLLPNGQEWKQPFTSESITKLSSVRMNGDLRYALEHLCNVKLAQKAFLDRFWAEKAAMERSVDQAMKKVQEASGELSHWEFQTAIEEMFRSKYPSRGGYDSHCYFELDSLSAKRVTMRHMQEVEKYATPERYPFLYRRYDDTMAVSESHPSYQSFCQRNAAPVIPALKDYCETALCAYVGDKNFLKVARNYTFRLAHGLSRQSLKDISAILDGTISQNKKSSLVDQISRADVKKAANPVKKTSRSKDDKTR